MARSLVKKVSVVLFVAVLVALLFFVFIPHEAQAEETLNILLTFDAVPPGQLFTKGSVSYIVKKYEGRLDRMGEPVTLVDPVTHKVTASSGSYYADGSDVLVPCDKVGKEIEGPAYAGEICFIVGSGEISPQLSADVLSKEYGDGSRSVIAWEKTEDGNTTIITFTSEGLAATALPGAYPLTLQSVTRNGFDVMADYTVTPMQAGSDQEAKVVVGKKTLEVSFASEQTVYFNNFLLAGESESVTSLDTSGVNGETVTSYFRLTEADRDKNVLTIGEHYQVEFFKFSVRDSEDQPISADCYSVSAALSEISTVRAVSGPITLYQGDKEAYNDRTDCVRFELDDFTFTYMDAFVSEYDGALIFTDIQLYEGITVDLRCSITCDASVIPCGTYVLTLLGVEQAGFEAVTLDAEFSMKVGPYELTYSDVDECQYGYKTFIKEVKASIPDREGEYTFSLSATIADGLAVGNAETKYSGTSAVSQEDPSVILTYDEARVRIVKRSTGVAFRAADDLTAVLYRDTSFIVCTLTFTENGKERALSASDIEYSYSGSDGNFNPGLPKGVGAYKVKCSVASSSSYTTDDALYDLTIVPRPVLVVYNTTKATKGYGEEYDFRTMITSVKSIFTYDVTAGEEDRSIDYRAVYNDEVPVWSGITCAGTAATSELGEYPISVTGGTLGNYDVKEVLLYDTTAKRETDVLTVEKGEAPPNTTVEVSYKGRTVTVSAAAGPALLQISEKSDFSDKSDASSQSGSANFTNRLYGQVYYVRACISDATHYKTANGAWSTVKTVAIPFQALSVTLQEDSVTDKSATFTVAELENSAYYVVEYKVGSNGKWKDGTTAEGLSAGKTQTVYFRAKAGDVKGQETSVSVTTLFAPVEEDALKTSYDRETGELTVTSTVEVEMRLLNASGEVLIDWTKESVFASVPRDAEYIVEVRNAADGDRSAVTQIKTDTYRKGPLSVLTYLSDWFLVWIFGVMVIVLVIIIICFVRSKKKMDRKLLGGKDGI